MNLPTMHIRDPEKQSYEGDGWLNYYYPTFCGLNVAGRQIVHLETCEEVTCEECVLLDFAYKEK